LRLVGLAAFWKATKEMSMFFF